MNYRKKLLNNLFKNLSCATIPEIFILFNGLVYVPLGLRKKIIIKNYEKPITEYQEINKTLKKITRTYYFPGMKKYNKIFCKICSI